MIQISACNLTYLSQKACRIDMTAGNIYLLINTISVKVKKYNVLEGERFALEAENGSKITSVCHICGEAK